MLLRIKNHEILKRNIGVFLSNILQKDAKLPKEKFER